MGLGKGLEECHDVRRYLVVLLPDRGYIILHRDIFCTVELPPGHTHYVMSVTFNPKDANTFASASLDKSIKVGKRHGSILKQW